MEFFFIKTGYSVNELILAFINLFIVFGDVIKNRKKPYFGYRLLRLAALSYAFNLFGALQWGLTDGKPGLMPWGVNLFGCALTILTPLIFSFSCALYAEYAICRNKERLQRIRRYYVGTFGLAGLIFLIGLPFHWFFSLGAENMYVRGPFLALYFVLPLCCQAYIIGKLIAHRKRLNGQNLELYTLLIISVMVMLGFIRQWDASSCELLFFHSIAMIAMLFQSGHDERLEKDKLYKTAFHAVNVAVAIFDAKGRCEYANPFYREHAAEITPGDSFAATEAFLRAKTTENQVSPPGCPPEETRACQGLIEANGRVYFVTLLTIAVLEETYKVACYTDMTDHLKMQDQLTQNAVQASLYEKAFDLANYGVSIFSSSEKIYYINKYYANLVYGKEPRDLIGGNVFSPCGTPEKAGVWRKNFYEAAAKQTGEICIPCNGQPYDFAYNIVTIDNPLKKEKNYICLLQDITQNKRLETQVSEQIQRLEILAKTKDEFISNISHEIRTPLNAIIGMIYFMKNTPLSNEQTNYISKIDNAAGILLSLVNDVLDFSKLNTNKFVLQNMPFKVRAVTDSVKAMFETSCQKKNIALTAHYDFDAGLTVSGDKVRFSQVILNLMSNAVKFTNYGAIDLYVHALEIPENRIRLHVSVKDTGIGIKKEDLARIWQGFEQADNSSTRRHEGTGLGLAISQQIIGQMGGKIWAESTPDAGSDFNFSIELEHMANIDETFDEEEMPAIELSDRKILLVEDNQINAEIAGVLIEQIGLSYDLASNGIEAVKYCREHEANHYDLILMDIHMPLLNGYEAAIKIRKELKLTVPIIALSAAVEVPEKQEKYKYFIDGYLTKPIQPIVLKKTLIQFLCGVKAQAAANNPAVEEALPDNPDTEEVLKSLGGNEMLLRHLLNRFKIENEYTAEEIHHLYLERRLDELLILLSHLRNSAANLGLREVDAAAETLIRSLKNDTVTAIEQHTKQIQQALDTAFQQIH